LQRLSRGRRPSAESHALDDLARREAQTAAELRENFAQLERHRTLASGIARDRFNIDSLSQQATQLRTSLGGLSDDDKKQIAEKPRYEGADEAVALLVRRLTQVETVISNAQASLTSMIADSQTAGVADLHEADALRELSTESHSLIETLLTSVSAAQDDFRAGFAEGSRVDDLRKAWVASKTEFDAAYQAAAARSDAHRSKLSQLAALEARQREQRTALVLKEEELRGLGDPEPRHAGLRARWREIQRERSNLLESQCDKMTDLSDGLICAAVERGAGALRLLDPIKTAVARSGLQAAKIETFLEKVVLSDDPLEAWHAALDELEQIVLSETPAHESPRASVLSTFNDADVARMVTRLDARAVLELGLAPLTDYPTFSYQAREGEYIAFKDASAGQQATALLRVLLKQAGPPLLIDQPEDDLDSKVIQEVVSQVWDAKHRRQLIFSSHNANLVVNGDAELVACCDYRIAGDHSGGRIKLRGAIDMPSVRQEITAVMEGGEKAFRLRKDKYGF
jgi:chromosome segregation protein